MWQISPKGRGEDELKPAQPGAIVAIFGGLGFLGSLIGFAGVYEPVNENSFAVTPGQLCVLENAVNGTDRPCPKSAAARQAEEVLPFQIGMGASLAISATGGFLLLRSKRMSEATAQELAATKVCPKCAESVKREALVCRFCSHEFLGEEP
jgi:hypothetical protein